MTKQSKIFPYTKDGYAAAQAFYDSLDADTKSMGTMKNKTGVLVWWEAAQVQDMKEKVKQALIKHEEGEGFVYLDNVYSEVEREISRHQFAGYLGALAKEGFYSETTDVHFGQIQIEDY